MVWSGDDPAKPLGNTVSTPPTSRSKTLTARPSTVTNCEFFLQLVTNRAFSGLRAE